jgi:hypothetical protein
MQLLKAQSSAFTLHMCVRMFQQHIDAVELRSSCITLQLFCSRVRQAECILKWSMYILQSALLSLLDVLIIVSHHTGQYTNYFEVYSIQPLRLNTNTIM